MLADWPHTCGAVLVTVVAFVLSFLFGGWSL
jgi:hypothetical protein